MIDPSEFGSLLSRWDEPSFREEHMVILHCRMSIDKEGKLERTTILVKQEEWPSGTKFIVETLRNGRSTSKAEPNLPTAFQTVGHILATF